MIGTTLGNYQILNLIGQGGMGSVYEAIQNPIGRRVAIKVLHAEYANDREVLKRFFNEARAANLVNHPSIVQVSDYGQFPNGSPYLVMEYLDGETLADRLEKVGGKLPIESALYVGWQLASALGAAHTSGIVHRDLKPSNIMLVSDALMSGGIRVKILDFGVAKLAQRTSNSANTRTGTVLGTPMYMSPEQCIGSDQVDGKTDVYALGIILYQVLAGAPPFAADSDLAVLNMQVSDPVPPLRSRAPSVPSRLADLLQKMLRKRADERPPMAEVAATLQRLGTFQSIEHIALVPKPGTVGNIEPETSGPQQGLGSSRTQSSVGQQILRRPKRWLVPLVAAFGAAILLANRSIVPVTNRTTPLPHPSIPSPNSDPHRDPDMSTQAVVHGSIELETEPSGAQVFDAEDDRLIGTTPWSSPLPTDGGDLWLLLRKVGFRDRVLRIKSKPGTSIQRHEVLAPNAPERRHPAGNRKQSIRIDDVKKRFFGNPDGGEVDIPETYRIVD